MRYHITGKVLALLLVAAPMTRAGAQQATDGTIDQRRTRLEETLARDPGDFNARLDYARVLHLQGIEGDEGAAEKGLGVLEELHDRWPEHPVVRVYLGSSLLLKAARTWAVWKKGSLSKEGLRHMEAAAEAAPEDPEVRFMRGASLRPLPFFFDQEAEARKELRWVADHAEEAVRQGELAPAFGAAALYYSGAYDYEAGRTEEARAAWQLAASLAPWSSAAADARRRLEETTPPHRERGTG